MRLIEVGRIDGEPVRQAAFGDDRGLRAAVMSWGGVLRSLSVPTPEGRREVTLGFASFEPYLDRSPYFGAVVGRYANRIADGRFVLDGREHRLDLNEGGRQHLHGGAGGFSMRNWDLRPLSDGSGVELSLTTDNAVDGYPGKAQARCVYKLEDDRTLAIETTVQVSEPCPINTAQHSYWNLDGLEDGGETGGTVDGHALKLHAQTYLPTGKGQIPTGEIRPVAGTPYDFRSGRKIGDSDPHLDHCFVADGQGLRPVAELTSSDARVRLCLEADQPGVQVYNGFKLEGLAGTQGRRFVARQGLCLETQGFPDAPNRPDFPNTILRPGEVHKHFMKLRFEVEG